MATYPNVNAANQYARDIVGGKILACQLTVLACQRHLDDLERAKDPHWPYRFDKNKAERFLRFAQKMPHTSGEWARRKLRIEFEAWQKFALGVPFGWVHKKTGLRRFSEIYIEVPRKNGKSAIAAAVGNYMFCADGEHGAEVYCGATTEKQAWKVFSPALQMVKKLPALRQKFSIKPWAKKMTRPDGSVFAPVIGDPGDGDSPSCAIIDEYHEHTTDALYTTMTTGLFSVRTQIWLCSKNRGKAGQLPLAREHRSEFSVQERPLCHRQIPLMTSSLLGPITRRLCPVGYQLAATSITRQRGRF